MKIPTFSCALTLATVLACGASESADSSGNASGGSTGRLRSTGDSFSGTSAASRGNIQSGGATSHTGGAAAGGVSLDTSGGTAPRQTSATVGKAVGGMGAAGGTTATSNRVSSGGTAVGSTVAIGGTKAAGGASVAGGKSGTHESSAGGSTVGGSTNTGGASPECTPPTSYENLFVTVSGRTQEQVDAKVSSAWSTMFNPSGSGTIYFNGPGSDESYVKDTFNNDVRSEGMSYGMMIAVQLDHQTEFGRLWTWVRNHMAQGCTAAKCTGEIVWSRNTSGGSNGYTGGAPDGEEYFATALIFAQNRWGNTGKYDYGAEAQWVLDLTRTKYFHTNPHLVKFLSSSNNTDASYVLPAFYQVWACFDTANAAFWTTAMKDGRDFFHKAVDGNGVCPDQSSWTGSTVKGPTADWIRCVANIMMDHHFFKADPWQTETYAPKFAAHQKSQNSGVAQMSCNSLLGFGLPPEDGKHFVDKLWSASIPSRDYWNGILYMLALVHVSGNFKLYY